jgi:hypothetical protein
MATAADTEVVLDPKRDRLVITASSLGTVFEWYDFFVYGILAALIGKLFFPADNPTAATLASLAISGRALVFGHLARYYSAISGTKSDANIRFSSR